MCLWKGIRKILQCFADPENLHTKAEGVKLSQQLICLLLPSKGFPSSHPTLSTDPSPARGL